jgi:hypothetical protein
VGKKNKTEKNRRKMMREESGKRMRLEEMGK